MKQIGVALILAACLVVPSQALAQGTNTPAPTFAKDVASIFQQKCQVCHRPDSIAPMSLTTYDEVRPWARSIKQKVSLREMPPWHLDKTVGIQKFVNDRSLTDQQIDTIVRWVDAGAPLGDPKDLPPMKQWKDDSSWMMAEVMGRPPDLVLKSKPYTVPATGQDSWYNQIVDIGLTEDRWVKAFEQRPSLSGRKVVHHAGTKTCQPEDPELLLKFFGLSEDSKAKVEELMKSPTPPKEVYAGCFQAAEWAQGKQGEVYADGTGKLIKAGAKIGYDIHYHPIGVETEGALESGIWFYPKGVVPKNRAYSVGMAGARSLDIPPNKVSMHTGTMVLQAPAILQNFQPHMHYRGKAQLMEAIYPDGRIETLNYVGAFNNSWHLNYIYAADAAPLLPKGTTVRMTYWHDNTAANKQNPDPRQWVGSGARTIDEMAHGNHTLVYLSQEDYDQMVKDRKAKSTSND